MKPPSASKTKGPLSGNGVWYKTENRQYLPQTKRKILRDRLGRTHVQKADQKEPFKDGNNGQMW